MTWVAVAVAGAAVVGGAASYMGSQKQASAAKHAADVTANQQQQNLGMQQPYIQSGYGALSRLNTLMGLSPDPNMMSAPPPQMPVNAPATDPSVSLTPAVHYGPRPWSTVIPYINQHTANTQPLPNPTTSPQLRQLLSIRAANGDAQASQLLKVM